MNVLPRDLAVAAVAAGTAWGLLGVATLLAVTRRTAPADAPIALVSVLKPVAGADPQLADGLRSFFVQDHPCFELVFGCEREDDPAVAVVRALIAEHPHVRARLVVHQGPRGGNPKVRNLRGIVAHATHDLVLVSDSNVRAPSGYLREAVACHREGVGLVTHLFVGEPLRGADLAAYVEALTLATFCAPGAALPTLAGHAAVIGKSMLFSRAELARLGGFERVADVLAEDYVFGRMFQLAGRRVALATTVLENGLGAVGVRAVFARHLRWSMLRLRLHPHLWLLEPLTSSIAVTAGLGALLGPRGAALGVALMLLRDVAAWIALRGARRLWIPLLLGPAREALMLAVWAATPWKRHVRWRGQKLRVESGTLLYDA